MPYRKSLTRLQEGELLAHSYRIHTAPVMSINTNPEPSFAPRGLVTLWAPKPLHRQTKRPLVQYSCIIVCHQLLQKPVSYRRRKYGAGNVTPKTTFGCCAIEKHILQCYACMFQTKNGPGIDKFALARPADPIRFEQPSESMGQHHFSTAKCSHMTTFSVRITLNYEANGCAARCTARWRS